MTRYDEFINKYKNQEPLRCYSELVTVGYCSYCTKINKCPFKVLLSYLKDTTKEDDLI